MHESKSKIKMTTELKQTGIRFPSEVLDKMKYIAWFDRRTVTNTIVIACEEYINEWESANDPITKDKMKKVKK